MAGLTEKGKSIAEKVIKAQCADIDMAIDGIIADKEKVRASSPENGF